MLEIFAIVMFSKKLAEIAQAKGRPRGWAALGAVAWILGEILGAMIGGIVFGEGPVIYLFALVGAVIGAVIAWVIVDNLSSLADPLDGFDATLGDQHGYAHADPNNPFSPPGYGKRE